MDIERLGPLSNYYHAVRYGGGFGPGPQCRPARDSLVHAQLSTEQQAELARLDGILIDDVVAADDDDVWWELLEDDPSQPTANWWWHLGAIRTGTYPTSLLPAHLLEVLNQARAS